MSDTGFNLSGVTPKIQPPLDPEFRPAALFTRAFRTASQAVPVRFALEQADGSVFWHASAVFPGHHPAAAHNFLHVQRLAKFLLWSRGGYRLYFDGPRDIGEKLQGHFSQTPEGRFDADIMGTRIYEKPFEVVLTRDLPAERAATTPLGRHLKGCRIGFDLGGSDRKAAAVIDGEVVFSDETVWDPYHKIDPQYHFDGIMDSLRKAAAHLPRVDAIGGSAAGVDVNNRVKVASLFRGIPADLFKSRVQNMFFDIQKAWNGVPLEVVNDGEVTALAGSLSLGRNGLLGVALGTSQAAGYVNCEGNITSWLNELAFVPVDMNPGAPRDEWSGDIGCGAQYFSQQAVGRLLVPAGIDVDRAMPLPEKLVAVQKLMAAGDPRARKIFQTIGVYLGYEVAHCTDFYNFGHVLILGRVTSGEGGGIILDEACAVLKAEFPDIARRVEFHTPSEKDKRHGQAIAAASLPRIDK